MLQIAPEKATKFSLWSRQKLNGILLQEKRCTYETLLGRTEGASTICYEDLDTFVNTQINPRSKKLNERKTRQMMKFLDITTVKTNNAVDISFLDFLNREAPDTIQENLLILRLNTDLYRIHDLVIRWEQTCATNQYQWWSNPFTNIIAYQIFTLTHILPMTLQGVSFSESVTKKKTKEDNMTTGILIYFLLNRITRKGYIGQTVNLKKRMSGHRQVTSGCTLIRNAIQVNGFSNFDKRVLATCDKTQANRLEAFFIQKYETLHPSGYNISAGNFTFTDEDIGSTTLYENIVVDELDAEEMILASVREIREFVPDNKEIMHDLKQKIKNCHPDTSTPDAEKCKELTKELNTLKGLK